MTRFLAVATAAGLLLLLSEPSFAAKQKSGAKSTAKSQSRATQPGGPAARPDGRDSHPFGRDHDPYARGVNWPKAW